MNEEKTIAGLNETEWKDRYISYMKSHSEESDLQWEESASIAWEESTDETPEECASEELSYWT